MKKQNEILRKLNLRPTGSSGVLAYFPYFEKIKVGL
jgi:hypothetical protein